MPAPVRFRRGAVAAIFLVTVAISGLVTACGGDGDKGPAVALSAAGERGRTVARDQGCTACHSADGGRSTGPTWKGLAGSRVKLDGGGTVTADDVYLARAITDPRADVVAGYANIMPTAYRGLDHAQVADLVAYLRDLAR